MLFSFILNILLSFLSYFVSKNKNQILIGSRDGKFADNTKYFFLYLVNNKPSFIFYWITKNKVLYNKFKKIGYPVVYLYSLKGIISILKSNFLLVNQLVNDISFSPILPGKFNLINLWHGTPFKKLTIHDIKSDNGMEQLFKKLVKYIFPTHFIFILSSSTTTSNRLKEAFNSKNFPILGYPRNDVFFKNYLIYEDYYSNLKLKEFSKVFLYCPTIRDRQTSKPFSNHFFSQLNQYLIEKNGIFLIKWHTYEKHQYPSENYSRIKDVTNEINDLQELLPFVDILITDYSSVSYDFSILEKPIIFYPYDYDDYVKSRAVYVDYFTEFPGPFVKNEDDLIEHISNIDLIFNDESYKKQYKKFQKKFNDYLDGDSSKRLTDFIKNMINKKSNT